jgi:hypothetical protein
MVREKFNEKALGGPQGGIDFELAFCDTDYLGILHAARDKIHLGHRLLTHPLSGSVKPGETPYKTIIISKEKGSLDEQSLLIIEGSIQTCIKLMASSLNKEWGDAILADFQLIDFGLIFG